MRDCPPGYFCEANTENYLDSPCPAGKWRAEPRGTASGDCDDCPAGMYCLAEVPEPIACPAGTFSTGGADAADSSLGSSPCTPCTAGSYCPHEGMIDDSYECGEGYYSQTGAQECTLCQSGYICDSTTVAAADYELDSNKCDGYKCEIWSTNIYEYNDCDEGHYCPSDSKV